MPKEMPEPKMPRPPEIMDYCFRVGLVISGWAPPFIRSHCGTHAFMYLWPVPAYLLFYAGYANLPELVFLIPVWLVMVIIRRVFADRSQDSLYLGWPIIGGLFTSRERYARLIEGGVVLGGGYLLGGPWGTFLMLTGLGLLITFWVDDIVVNARIRAMNDARIRGQNMVRIQSGQR